MGLSPQLTAVQSTYLDFARATAAMIVLLGHASLLFLRDSAFCRMDLQAIGVLVFFLMSGFLISYSVFRKWNDKTYTFRHYFIDRLCRIYCVFVPALIFVWAIDTKTFSLPLALSDGLSRMPSHIPEIEVRSNLHTWIGNLFMLQDFPLFQIARRVGIPIGDDFLKSYGSGTAFWTLSIEWWIYMVFGMVAIYIIRDKKPITLVFLTILGLVSIEPFYYLIGGIDNCLTFLWIFGMLVSLLFLRLPTLLNTHNVDYSSKKWKLIYGGIFVASLILMAGRLMAIKFDQEKIIPTELQFGVFMTLGVFSLLFFFGQFASVPQILRRITSFAADYSYSLYLSHIPVLTYLYVRYPGHDNDPAFFWGAVILCNIVGIIFWACFERHHRRVAVWLKAKTDKERKALA